MTIKKTIFSVLGIAGVLFSTSAIALPSTQYTRVCKPLSPTEGKYEDGRVQSITSESAYKKLTAANEAYADEKYDESMAILRELIANSSDKVAVGRARTLLGQNYRAREQYDAAIREFKAALDSGFLPKKTEVDVRQIIASLYAAQEKYDLAIKWQKDYFKDAIKPPASSYAMLASFYYQNEDLRNAICPAYIGLQQGSKSKKALYGMLFGAHVKLKDYAGAEAFGEEMVELFPTDKSAYNNLFAVYSFRNKTDDMLALAELAYMNGIWQSETNYKQLSALYANKQIPLLAAARLEEGIEKGIVESTESNWKNIANNYYFAKAKDEAIRAYKKASEFTTSGKYDYNIGNLYFDNEEYDRAIESYRKALRKGSLKEGDAGFAYIQMGVAYMRLGNEQEALRIFNQAKNYSNVARNANAYIAYINQINQMKKSLQELASE